MKKAQQNRTLVFRNAAENNLFITLVSFAASITLTRSFLHLTGFPQLGGEELHIAHVLWGGLLMFAAILALLLYSNRWVHTLAAVLSGLGIGLFMDEVGKFITQTNDYFYPAAAPIIYAFFLLTLFLYLLIRKERKPDVRAAMYEVFEDLHEYLDHDLSEMESKVIIEKLVWISDQKNHRELVNLANQILQFIENKELVHSPHRHTVLQRWKLALQNFFQRWLPRTRMRLILSAAWLGWGIWTVFFPLRVLIDRQDALTLQRIIAELVDAQIIRSSTTLLWFQLRIGLSAALGILMITAAVFLFFKKEKAAINAGFWVLLLSFTVSNLLLFYFEQFSTIFNAVIQIVLLTATLAYQRMYLNDSFDTI